VDYKEFPVNCKRCQNCITPDKLVVSTCTATPKNCQHTITFYHLECLYETIYRSKKARVVDLGVIDSFCGYENLSASDKLLIETNVNNYNDKIKKKNEKGGKKNLSVNNDIERVEPTLSDFKVII